jgi:hypothetical protein
MAKPQRADEKPVDSSRFGFAAGAILFASILRGYDVELNK